MTLDEVSMKVAQHDVQLENLERRQNEMDGLVTAMSAMQNEQKHIKEDVVDIKKNVTKLIEAPGKKWEKVIEAIIATLVGAFLGYLFKGVI